MKIVDAGYKLDLHIHSIYSKGKDKDKVNYNTLNHVGELVKKLTENGVQLCAITDHDAFGYDMYLAMKNYECKEGCSVVRVFPGIEFSVEFKGKSENAIVHVIAIFDNANIEKISKIESCFIDESGQPTYDCEMAFSEEKFLSILRKINLDTVLIAHQKNTLTSQNARKSDANSVGEERFQEFIYTDFFEAFEFKNKKNEIFNKSYAFSRGIVEDIRFITGSDCHDWRCYPKETVSDNSEFRYTYVKCLPTFRGLVMAITDYRRIKTVNSFFNPAETYLPSIIMTINGVDTEIPLSRGINVIIGDNSIGKSLLLHKITDYRKKQSKLLKPSIAKSYDKYLKQNGITIHSK